MTRRAELGPRTVCDRLRAGARLFRFMDPARARLAMEGRLPDDGALGPPAPESFAAVVERRLAVPRTLDRRRRALLAARPASRG